MIPVSMSERKLFPCVRKAHSIGNKIKIDRGSKSGDLMYIRIQPLYQDQCDTGEIQNGRMIIETECVTLLIQKTRIDH